MFLDIRNEMIGGRLHINIYLLMFIKVVAAATLHYLFPSLLS